MTYDQPNCELCWDSGVVFQHSPSCRDDLCALNGDIHSCNGEIVACSCGAGAVKPEVAPLGEFSSGSQK